VGDIALPAATQQSTFASHVTTALDHIASSLASISKAVQSEHIAIAPGATTANSPDAVIAIATIALAVATFFVAIVPLFLDWRARARQTEAARTQMIALIKSVKSRVDVLQGSPSYRATILLEGSAEFLLRALQSDIGSAFKGAHLATIYDSLNEGLQALTEARERQLELRGPSASQLPLEELQRESDGEIRKIAREASEKLAVALDIARCPGRHHRT
jgi:hypothetical protein